MKKKQKVKNELVFDNRQREEFLKGFSKRKKQRQKKAQEEIEQKLKEERKKIKDEAKNLKEKFKQSFKPIDELKNIVSDDDESEAEGEEFETEDVKVVVKSLELPRKRHALAPPSSEDDADEDEEDGQQEQLSEIKGMELESERKSKGEDSAKASGMADQLKIGSKKDLKRLIDKHTKTAMKKSGVLQKKNLLNHKRNVKLSQRKKHFKTKFLKKHKKLPNKWN